MFWGFILGWLSAKLAKGTCSSIILFLAILAIIILLTC